MLPERYRQLLTAYLDGELSPRGRKTALRLLRASRRARAFYRKLEHDSRRLRALQPPAPAPDFAPRVLGAIAEQGLRPTTAPAAETTPAAASLPSWAGIAVAASVLVAVTLGSYLFFSAYTAREAGPVPLAQDAKPQSEPDEPGLRVALRQLSSPAERGRLVRELRKDTSYQLSLTCPDSARAVDRLDLALRKNGIHLLRDRTARERLGKNKHTTRFLLYAENLLPEELAAILRQLGAEGPVETAFVTSLTEERRQELARLLGVGPDKLRPPARAADVPLPSLKDTLIEGRAEQSANKSKAADAPERLALVLAYDAANPGPEVRDFLRRRRQQRPGTLQVVLVLREARVS